jgi:hypothetical protein
MWYLTRVDKTPVYHSVCFYLLESHCGISTKTAWFTLYFWKRKWVHTALKTSSFDSFWSIAYFVSVRNMFIEEQFVGLLKISKFAFFKNTVIFAMVFELKVISYQFYKGLNIKCFEVIFMFQRHFFISAQLTQCLFVLTEEFLTLFFFAIFNIHLTF